MVCFDHFLVSVYAVVCDVLTPALNVSRLGCTTSCFRDTTCSTFFYNEETGSCYFQNRWLENLNTPGIPNIYYFLIYPDTCNIAGYRFIRKVSLCLKISSEEQSWDSASSKCQTEGARLIKIDTEDKNSALHEMLTPDYLGFSIHLGGHDPNHNRQWVWSDGSPMRYAAWAPTEPNNSNDEEYCSEMYVLGPAIRWNDVRCDITRRYICEKVIN